jgi:IS30 family transposase
MEMYTHLTKQTRIELGVLLRADLSLREAAKLLSVHHTTLSRELQRNQPVQAKQRYHPGDAHRSTKARRRSANQHFRKILLDSKLEALLVTKIRTFRWAPEQCAGWLRTFRRSLYVCAQTIYDWIYQQRRDLLRYLHCLKGKYRRTRQARARKQKRAVLASPRNIAQRPKHVGARKTYGHWEGDTVHGKGKTGYIATFVERKSGYLVTQLLPVKQFGSLGFAEATAECLNQLPAQYRKTLTLDNGPEMKMPEKIERTTGVEVYYANPYHSWERGTNENTNGLLRYFFPKQSSFAALTQVDIDQAVVLLNTRPRKRLNWRTPEQMLKRGGAL